MRTDPPASAPARDPERVARRARGRWITRTAARASVALGLAVLAPLVGGGLLVWQLATLADLLHRAVVLAAPREALLGPLLLVAGLTATRAGLAALGEAAGALGAEAVKRHLRVDLFHRLADRPAGATSSGALAATLVDGVEALHGFLADYLPALAAATLLPLALAACVLAVEPVVGLLLLVTAPLIPVFMALVGWGAEAAQHRHQVAFARLSGLFADRLRGLLTLRLFGRGEAEALAMRTAGEDLRARTMSVLRIAFLSSAVLEFFAALGVAGVALYVGLTYLSLLPGQAGLDLERGLFCLMVAPEVYGPLRRFATHYHDRAAAMAFAAEAEAVFGALSPPVAAASAGGAALPPGPLALEVAGLTGAWDAAAPVLDAAGFAVAAGAHIALVGASGAGKSTLLKALGRLRPAAGTVRLGGVDLAALDETVLRERVAILPQRPHLFAGTITSNIRLGDPEAAAAAVAAAAARAGVLRFAATLPEGLATPVGEGGFGLSGGEAQRVALARLYLRQPDLILLDEPTAQLDPETEAFVLDGLCDFARGRTLLVATHSEAVAARMDRALRITGGQVLPTTLPPHHRREADRAVQVRSVA